MNSDDEQYIVKNGRIVDENRDQTGDVLIRDGIIEKIADDISECADTVIDAAGKAVLPGLIDMHVHLRDPGYTYKEDILSGCEAAGGRRRYRNRLYAEYLSGE